MIVEAVLNLLKGVITTVFGILPNIPTLEVQNTINEYFSLIFSNLSLLGIFVRVDTLKLLIPVIIVIWNFEHIYNLTMWILKKIPFFNVD